MNCHTCPFAIRIENGAAANMPYEDTPCATCPAGQEPSSFAIEYHEDRLDPEESRPVEPSTDMLPVTVLTDMARGILRLPPHLRDIISARLAGRTYREISEAEGISIQAAAQREKRALQHWPALQALFPRKIQKQKTRRSNRKSIIFTD